MVLRRWQQLLLICILLPIVRSLIKSDGNCPLFIFTPFSTSNAPSGTLSGRQSNLTNKGFSHMAAALLAMEHFNTRNASVVQELTDFEECSIRFDMNQSKVFDTGSVTHQASQSLWEQDIIPCAMAGPFNDVPAIELSVMATAGKIPMVAHRAHNLRITSDHLGPFSSQVFPGTISSAHKLVEFLRHKGRTDYIGVMYSLTETGVQRQEALAIELDDSHMEWLSAGYSLDHDHGDGHGHDIECSNDHDEHNRAVDEHSKCDDTNGGTKRAAQVVAFNITFEDPEETHDGDSEVHGNVFDKDHMDESQDDEELLQPGEGEEHADGEPNFDDGKDGYKGEGEHVDQHSVLGALQKIKESGYRTVVVAMEFPDDELPLIAEAAEKLRMNQGDYFWVWYDVFEPDLVHSENSFISKLVSGSTLLMPTSEAFLQPETSAFAKSWSSQGKTEVDRLNAANPINPGEAGYVFANDDWFQAVQLEWGSDFMYDAVMSVGIGACMAQKSSIENISSIGHQSNIRQANFTGATGPVTFGGEVKSETGARDPLTVSWAEINVLPPQASGNETDYFSVTGVYDPETKHWHHVAPFIYRDGRTVPPELLRDEPDQNYLSRGLRIMGYTLMSIALFGAIASAIWVYLHRNHRVLRAAQPVFLYLIAFGSAVEALTIMTISNDENYGWNTESLSIACMANPWLLSTGHIMIYTSLFSKLWRINKVLQFSRRKIQVRHVAGPMVLIVMVALLILSLWTAFDPLIWTRVEINDVTGESIGQCNSERFAAFIIPLIAVMLIPTILTAVMAWKTMDVDKVYAESKSIFFLILVQLEVVVVAAPLIFILRDVSTDGRYVGFMFMLWVFPMSTILLIFLPKYSAYRKALRGADNVRTVRGRRAQGVTVSGINTASNSKQSYTGNGCGGSLGDSKFTIPNESASEVSVPQEVSGIGHSDCQTSEVSVLENIAEGIESDGSTPSVVLFNDESSLSEGDDRY